MLKQNADAEVTAKPAPEFTVDLYLRGINTPSCATYLINKPEFVLGKQEECDGVLLFSKEIDRRHAKIVWRDNTYYIIDLDSVNRTFVNGKAIPSQYEKEIRPGDRIALSTSVFQVEKINR